MRLEYFGEWRRKASKGGVARVVEKKRAKVE